MPDPAAFDLPLRRALAAVSPEARTVWRLRYSVQEGTELHAQGLLEKVERELRATGAETTIHALWVALWRTGRRRRTTRTSVPQRSLSQL